MSGLIRYGAAVALALAALYGSYQHGITTERTRQGLAAQTERLEAAKLVIAEQDRSARKQAELDDKYSGELKSAYAEIDSLMLRGPGRVFVRAKCPASPAVPAGTTAGMGDRGEQRAELDDPARADLDALYRQLKRREAALALCVGAVTEE